MGNTSAGVVDAILHQTPLPVAKFNPDVPPELQLVINKGLEKDRKLRYQTASEIRADLQRVKRDSDPLAVSKATVAASPRTDAGIASVPPEALGKPDRKAPGPTKSKTLAIIAAALAIILAVIVFVRWPTAKEASETYLDIQANPGAQLVIDDKVAGSAGSDGVISVKVSPGTHLVHVSLEGYAPWSKEVTIKAGSRVSVVAELNTMLAVAPPPATEAAPSKPTLSGTLMVRSNVPGADVFIDGQLKGVTGHDNKLKVDLAAGSHKVQVTKSGYVDFPEQRIEIAARKETQLSLTLEASTRNPMAAPVTEAPKATNSPDINNLVSAGKREYENGKYDSAIASYQKALRIDPHNATAQAGLNKAQQAKQTEEQPVAVDPQPSPAPAPATITRLSASPETLSRGRKPSSNGRRRMRRMFPSHQESARWQPVARRLLSPTKPSITFLRQLDSEVAPTHAW